MNVSSRDLLSFIAPAPSGESQELHSTFAVTHLLKRRFVPKSVLARLDDEGETSGNGLGRLCCLGLLSGSHLVSMFLSGG